jgi:hypothetical protein
MATWIYRRKVGIELPGPANWWPKDYDFERHRFDVPSADNGEEEAFAMLFVDEEPERYAFIFPSDQDLRVMMDTAEARLIQRQML